MTRRTLLLIALLPILLLMTQKAGAVEPPLTYRYLHFLYTVRPSPAWKSTQRVWTFNGKPFLPPASLLVDGDNVPPFPPGVEAKWTDGWNREAVKASIAASVGKPLHRDPGEVTIKHDGTGSGGKITFEGVGLTGRDVDLDRAADLTIAALEKGVSDIVVPITETQPKITITDPALVAQGIREVVTVGESDFSNSPSNRRHNIATGLARFNGHLIPQGTIFSFDQTLGRVDGTTGYLKELVIKGSRTEPDFGGGLCQVSTTAYRGVWEYGFPITQRLNHSYSVSHYFPQGTDATVYPPSVDMKFKNDSPGALLIQTYSENDLAYFIYYGTRDDRKSSVIGPFTWGHVAPPPDRTEYTTTELKPGEKKKMGERVPGISTLWYRFVKKGDVEKAEPVVSKYEARPLYYLIGVATMPQKGTGSGAAVPTLFMED